MAVNNLPPATPVVTSAPSNHWNIALRVATVVALLLSAYAGFLLFQKQYMPMSLYIGEASLALAVVFVILDCILRARHKSVKTPEPTQEQKVPEQKKEEIQAEKNTPSHPSPSSGTAVSSKPLPKCKAEKPQKDMQSLRLDYPKMTFPVVSNQDLSNNYFPFKLPPNTFSLLSASVQSTFISSKQRDIYFVIYDDRFNIQMDQMDQQENKRNFLIHPYLFKKIPLDITKENRRGCEVGLFCAQGLQSTPEGIAFNNSKQHIYVRDPRDGVIDPFSFKHTDFAVENGALASSFIAVVKNVPQENDLVIVAINLHADTEQINSIIQKAEKGEIDLEALSQLPNVDAPFQFLTAALKED